MNHKTLIIYKISVSIYIIFSILFFLASIIVIFYPNKYHYVYIQKVITHYYDQSCFAYISNTFNSSNYTIITLNCSYSSYAGKNITVRLCTGLLNSNLQDYCSNISYNYSLLMILGSIILLVTSFYSLMRFKIKFRNNQIDILARHLYQEERRRNRRMSFHITRPAPVEIINNHFEIPIREISNLEPNQSIATAAGGNIVKILNP